MTPQKVYEPRFIKHNLFRYKEMQADLLVLIQQSDQHTLFMDIRHLNEEEIRIYVKHILTPFTKDNRFPYHIIICVGRTGENKMTALKNSCKEYFVQYSQVTRRRLEIYG